MSARWNSGRLLIISAIVSPRRSPSPCRAPASASTCSRSSLHVHSVEPSSVRTATSSARSADVSRKASARLVALTPRGGTAAVSPAMPSSYSESLAAKRVDVVGQADHENRDDEHEADDARALHDGVGDRLAADLLGHRPEDVAAVERQEREHVDDRQREADDREDLQGIDEIGVDRLAGGLEAADHAADLLARLLGVEELAERRH